MREVDVISLSGVVITESSLATSRRWIHIERRVRKAAWIDPCGVLNQIATHVSVEFRFLCIYSHFNGVLRVNFAYGGDQLYIQILFFSFFWVIFFFRSMT